MLLICFLFIVLNIPGIYFFDYPKRLYCTETVSTMSDNYNYNKVIYVYCGAGSPSQNIYFKLNPIKRIVSATSAAWHLKCWYVRLRVGENSNKKVYIFTFLFHFRFFNAWMTIEKSKIFLNVSHVFHHPCIIIGRKTILT